MEDQRLLPCLADPLSEASPAHQIRCNGGILTFIHIPGHDLAAPGVDHQVEVQPDPAHGGWQVRDDPTPHLIGFCGQEPWHWSWFLWWPGSSAPLDLAVGMDYSVEAAL